MNEFLEYILWELKNSFGIVIIAGVCAALVLGAAYFIFKSKHKDARRFPWGKALLYLALVGYLTIVLYATILRFYGGFRSVNFHLFRAWREAWNNYSVKNWLNVLLNVAMFVPLGVLLPLVWKWCRKWYFMLLMGFGTSLLIELVQLATVRGVFDVDDLFANTIGAVIGFFMIMTVLSAMGEKGKRLKPSLVYGVLAAASVVAFGGIFVAYELQEYGNLPGAAAYRVDTSDVVWTLDCSLPESKDKVPTYTAQTYTIEETDAFGAAFAQIVGAEFDDIMYYDKETYFIDHSLDENGSHFLFVSYLDGSYEYSGSWDDNAQWADADRETLEDLLNRFLVTVPEQAEFTVEGDGWHSFRIDQYVDGTVMLDGVLRCRYAADGTIREIENDLITYTYHDDVGIISAEEAYARLCTGYFNDGNSFAYYAPERVSVFSCTLGYEIDTKGFYQPVYVFDVASDDGDYQARILIPAMR